ncbi:hypothetical protein SmJEL517_g05355 [Synchytrium microbalum]|uniref:GATA-type domain-containing protein n=1 Tax=Synchytrium microbalum TaxID=1806994 RepID=A0A507C170_9FUNG|nr:uncharacterized protein SmJEL517_g05355 [Synchytrium microbalum]TPX31253.1 hypothetical protein SmJEL517_g05355 [Synchytrium microbalum]
MHETGSSPSSPIQDNDKIHLNHQNLHSRTHNHQHSNLTTSSTQQEQPQSNNTHDQIKSSHIYDSEEESVLSLPPDSSDSDLEDHEHDNQLQEAHVIQEEHQQGDKAVAIISAHRQTSPPSQASSPSILSNGSEHQRKQQDAALAKDDPVLANDEGPPYLPTKIGEWRCTYCGVFETECRRRGPREYDKLCNRCGARWSRGTILEEYPKALYPGGGEGGARREIDPSELADKERIKREASQLRRYRLRRSTRQQSSSKSNNEDESADLYMFYEYDDDGAGGIAARLKSRRGRGERQKSEVGLVYWKSSSSEHASKKVKVEEGEEDTSDSTPFAQYYDEFDEDADDEQEYEDDEHVKSKKRARSQKKRTNTTLAVSSRESHTSTMPSKETAPTSHSNNHLQNSHQQIPNENAEHAQQYYHTTSMPPQQSSAVYSGMAADHSPVPATRMSQMAPMSPVPQLGHMSETPQTFQMVYMNDWSHPVSPTRYMDPRSRGHQLLPLNHTTHIPPTLTLPPMSHVSQMAHMPLNPFLHEQHHQPHIPPPPQRYHQYLPQQLPQYHQSMYNGVMATETSIKVEPSSSICGPRANLNVTLSCPHDIVLSSGPSNLFSANQSSSSGGRSVLAPTQSIPSTSIAAGEEWRLFSASSSPSALYGQGVRQITSILCECLNINPLTMLWEAGHGGPRPDGFEIDVKNLDEAGETGTLKITGEEYITSWAIEEPPDHPGSGPARCALLVSGATVQIMAIAVDSELPKAPEVYHIMLKYKPSWVPLPVKEWTEGQVFVDALGVKHTFYNSYPPEGIQEFHKERNLFIE